MSGLKKILSYVFFIFFGKLNWNPPPWMEAVLSLKRRKPGVFNVLLLLLLAGFIGAGAGYIIFSLDKNKIDAYPIITPPKIFHIDQTPATVEIEFVKDKKSNGKVSVSKLALTGKKIKSGIKIFPDHPGEWKWEDDRTLKFYTGKPWPSGTKFEITLSDAIFKKGVRLKSNKIFFKTDELKANISSFRFYTDPRKRKIHKGVATIEFNYPVEPKSLKNSIFLGEDGKELSFDLSFDKSRHYAYIHSKPLKIGLKKKYLKLFIEKGVRTTLGDSITDKSIKSKIVIPSMDTFFHVNSCRTKIIRDKDNNPEQALILHFSDAIKASELKGKIGLYLLPKKEGKRVRSAAQVTSYILKRSSKIPLKFPEMEKERSENFAFIMDTIPGRKLFIHMEKGLKSDTGFFLSRSFNKLIYAPSYPKELQIMGDGGIISLSGEKKLSFQSRGIRAIKVKIKRLLDNQLQHLITQSSGDMNEIRFSNYYFNEKNISEEFEKVIYLSDVNPKKAVYSSMDLSRYLDLNGKKPGYFFIEAKEWRPARKQYGYISSRKAVLITDLAILIKKNTDNSRDVFVQSISNGEPVYGAKVSILGKNGLPVHTGYTDISGHIYFQPLDELRNEKEPVACMASLGRDISFIKLDSYQRQMELSGFDTGGIQTRYMDKKRLKAFMFTDRGIYRPGEDFNIGVMLRHKGFEIPAGVPVEYDVYDSRGSLRVKQRLKTPESGFFDIGYQTKKTDPTGRWETRVYLISKKGYRERSIGNISFNVETFTPDKLKISSRLSSNREGWIKPDKLKANVKLMNMFGSPAQNRKITATAKLKPSGFFFRKFKGYRFKDPLYSKDRVFKTITRELAQKKTDINGEAVLNLDMKELKNGTYLLNLMVRGYEENGSRSVAAENSALVSPLDFIVGYKSDSELSYLKKDSEAKVSLIAVNQSLVPVDIKDLKIKKLKIKTISALVKKNDGTFGYKSVKKEELLSADEMEILKSKTDISLDTSTPGNFALEIYQGDTLLSRIEYDVAGSSNLTGEIDKASELGIKFSEKNIKAGESLELEITCPYKGSGLITIESDHVHKWKWFKADQLKTIENIKIPENIEGNAYISVSMVRSPDDPSIFQSPLSYAVKPFYIDRAKRTLNPELSLPEKIKPGEVLPIEFKTERPAKIAVFLADSGILQKAGYRLPNPLDFFLRKKALEVKTAQLADLILPEYSMIRKKLGIGGGFAMKESEDMIAGNLNPFQRRAAKSVVKWFGILDSTQENKRVLFQVPDDFTGELKIMAVACDDEGMGSSSAPVLVKGPFAINPSLPFYLSPGDKFKIKVNLANLIEGSGNDLPVKLSVKSAPGIKILDESVKDLKINENSEAVAEFDAVAEEKYGDKTLTFKAESGEYSSIRTFSAGIIPAAAHTTRRIYGLSRSASKTIEIKKKLIKEFSSESLMVSSSPAALINGLGTWLKEFPHGCTEQVISRAVPALMDMDSGAEKIFSSEERKKYIEEAINILNQRRVSYKGFSLWPGGEIDPFVSLYAANFIVELKSSGLEVSRSLLNNTKAFLREMAASQKDDLFSLRLRAYAIYLLTRMGYMTSNHLADLEDSLKSHKEIEKDIIFAFMAGSYKLLMQTEFADMYIAKYEISDSDPDEDWNWFANDVTNPLYIYILGANFPEKLKKLDLKDTEKLLSPIFNGRFNTISSAMTILALNSWKNNLPEDRKKLDAVFTLYKADGTKTEKSIKDKYSPYIEFENGMEKIKINSNPPYFYSVSQSGFDSNPPKKDEQKGVEVVRSFESIDGKELKEIHPGDEFYVVLKLRSLTGKYLHNMVVMDLFSGGIMPDEKSIRNNTRKRWIDYSDIREDRLVIYCGISPGVKTIKYRARAFMEGDFIIPPVYAKSMYNPEIYSETASGRIVVSKEEKK